MASTSGPEFNLEDNINLKDLDSSSINTTQ